MQTKQSARADIAQFQQFGRSHPEADRTLRMDSGGVCHLCGRKAARRVELHTPLWPSGPIMYGDCCLAHAEAALYARPSVLPVPAARPRAAARRFGLVGLALAAAAGLTAGIGRLLGLS